MTEKDADGAQLSDKDLQDNMLNLLFAGKSERQHVVLMNAFDLFLCWTNNNLVRMSLPYCGLGISGL
jgi:hypothetical protein